MKTTVAARHHAWLQAIFLLLCIVAQAARAQTTAATIPDEQELFALPEYINQIIDERIKPLRSREARLQALLHLVYMPDALNLQYQNDITRTPQQTLKVGAGNCVSLSYTVAAMARRANLKVHFMESTDPGRWRQLGEHYALEKHMSLFFPVRSKKTRGYHVDFQYANPEVLQHKKLSDDRALSDFYTNRAVEHMYQHELDTAAAFARKAIDASPRYDAAWLNYGLIEKKRGNPAAALSAYKKTLKLNRRNLSAYNNLLALFVEQGQLEQAQKLRKKVEKYRRKNPFHQYSYGQLEIRQKQYDSAIEHFERAIKLDKKIPHFYLGLAEALYLNGDAAAAINALQEGLKYNTDNHSRKRFLSTIDFLQSLQRTAGA